MYKLTILKRADLKPVRDITGELEDLFFILQHEYITGKFLFTLERK